MSELNLQAKWFNANKDANTVQEIIEYVFLQHSASKMSNAAYEKVMVVLATVRDDYREEAEQYQLLQSIKEGK